MTTPVNPPGQTALMMAYTRSLPRVDAYNPEALEQRLNDYFSFCAEHEAIPIVETMCNALGFPQRTVRAWRSGQIRSFPKECKALLDDAHDQILSGITSGVMDGRINPVWGMFYLKVHGRYNDRPELDNPVEVQDEKEQTAQDIMMKYQDIPDD